jgi:hypothetical protein
MTTTDYHSFLSEKLAFGSFDGIPIESLPDWLFPHQQDLVRWALRRGRGAIFADTGLGKTRMQLAWADAIVNHTGGSILILAPLAVAEQTVEEGASVGVTVTHCRTGDDVRDGINITNYERLHRFDPSQFVGVVLDESSIIKHETSKTLQMLLDAFARTPYRLCATATPAPNDWTELGTHAEFLGVRSHTEMLCEFFVHDGGETQTWRLKKHARREFWRWVSSWGALIRSPADLGHDDSAYRLPPVTVHQHTVESPVLFGQLFAMEAQTLSERRTARRESIAQRVAACAEIVNATDETWLVWCELNAEGDALRQAIPGSVEVRGSDSVEDKERRLLDFAHGKTRVLISKPSICGFGLNLQVCHNMAFVGVTDSWESYYQAVRRCWRFGQTKPVDVHIFCAESEGAVVANLARKETAAKAMQQELARETIDAVRESVLGSVRETNAYTAQKRIAIPSWLASENIEVAA